jgi:arabinofuranosyltransferase
MSIPAALFNKTKTACRNNAAAMRIVLFFLAVLGSAFLISRAVFQPEVFSMWNIFFFVLEEVIQVCLFIYCIFFIREFTGSKILQWLLAVLCFLFIGYWFSLGLIDDTYISLRYAKNFASGHGMVFNAGEHVEGYVCFLWIVLLGSIKKIVPSADLVELAKLSGIFFGVATIAVIDRFSSCLHAPDAGTDSFLAQERPFFSLLLMAFFPYVFWCYSGMETGLYLFLLVSAAFFFCRYLIEENNKSRHLVYSAVLMACALMTRPETLVPAGLSLGFILCQGKQGRLKNVLSFSVPLVLIYFPYFLWRYTYYGYLLPNPYYAKVGSPSLVNILHGIAYIKKGIYPCLLFIIFIFSKIIRKGAGLKMPELYLLFLVAATIFTILATGADHFNELRYVMYMLPFMYLFCCDEIAGCIEYCACHVLDIPAYRDTVRRQFLYAMCVIIFTCSFFCNYTGIIAAKVYGKHLPYSLALLGDWLDKNTGPGTVIAAPVIGALSYYTDKRVIDMLGLTEPAIAHTMTEAGRGPRDHEKFNTPYILSKSPDYIHLYSYPQPPEALETNFLKKPAPLPALEDLKRFFPNSKYRYITIEIKPYTYALYQKIK